MHMDQSFTVRSLNELSTTEMQRIHGLACGDRIVAPGGFTPDWDEE